MLRAKIAQEARARSKWHLLLQFLLFLIGFVSKSIHKLRENVSQEHQTLKEKELQTGPKASHGYGGKFGVEQDRMDKVSVEDFARLMCCVQA